MIFPFFLCQFYSFLDPSLSQTQACISVSGGPENVSKNEPNVVSIDKEAKEKADQVMEIVETGVQDSPQPPSSASDKNTFEENKAAREKMPHDENGGSISHQKPNVPVIVVATEIVEAKEDVVQQALFVGEVSDDQVVLEELPAAKRMKFSDEKPPQKPENKKTSEKKGESIQPRTQGEGAENNSDSVWRDEKTVLDENAESSGNHQQSTQEPILNNENEEKNGNIQPTQGEGPNSNCGGSRAGGEENRADKKASENDYTQSSENRQETTQQPVPKKKNETKDGNIQPTQGEGPNSNSAASRASEEENKADNRMSGNVNTESSGNCAQTTQEPESHKKNETKDDNIQPTQGVGRNKNNPEAFRASGEVNNDGKKASESVNAESSGKRKQTTQEPVPSKKNKKDGDTQPTQGEGPNSNSVACCASEEENKADKKMTENVDTESSANNSQTTQETEPNKKNETKDGNTKPTPVEEQNNNSGASCAGGEGNNVGKKACESVTTEPAWKRQQTAQEPVLDKGNDGGGASKIRTRSATQEQRSGGQVCGNGY